MSRKEPSSRRLRRRRGRFVQTVTKRYNWTTGPNQKSVDVRINRAAVNFISGCNHLTPAAQIEMDNLLESMTREVSAAAQTVCKPDQDILTALNAPPQPDWMESAEPTDAELNAIDRTRAAH